MDLKWGGAGGVTGYPSYWEPDTPIKFTEGVSECKINGEKTIVDVNPSVVPFIDETSERFMLPLRTLSEALGYEVSWISETEVIRLTKGGLRLDATLASPKIRASFWENGQENWSQTFEMDANVQLSNDRTFVPVRFVSELFGYRVSLPRGFPSLASTETYRTSVFLDEKQAREYVDCLPIAEKNENGGWLLGLQYYNAEPLPKTVTFSENARLWISAFQVGADAPAISVSEELSRLDYAVYPATPTLIRHDVSDAPILDGLCFADICVRENPDERYRVYFENGRDGAE
jgi:hypothetical protein